MYGKRLKQIREKKKLNRKALAGLAGVSPAMVSELENDHKRFLQESFEKILDAMNVTPEEFFCTDAGIREVLDEISELKASLQKIASPGDEESGSNIKKKKAM